MLATTLETYRPTQAASLPLLEVPINTNAVATHSCVDLIPFVQSDDSVESINATVVFRTSWKSFNLRLGVLSVRLFLQQQEKAEKAKKRDSSFDKTYVINFLLKFGSCRKGFKFRVNDTFDMFFLNSIRRVPDDSPIFWFCRNGDLESVKKLIYSRTASALDVDNDGWSPLHVCFNYSPSFRSRQ